jgi:hypothetical protein
MFMIDDAWELIGAPAYDMDGQPVGEVIDVYLDPATGEPALARLALPRHNQALVPLRLACPQGLAFATTKATITRAPKIDMVRRLSDTEMHRVLHHYGLDQARPKVLFTPPQPSARTEPAPRQHC